MSNAAKIVSSAVLGLDFKTVIVNGKAYIITPPTIRRIAGASYCLSGKGEGQSIREYLMSVEGIESLACALSWFIAGDDRLSEELKDGTFDEVVDALDEAYSLISIQSFRKLLDLEMNVSSLTAKQR